MSGLGGCGGIFHHIFHRFTHARHQAGLTEAPPNAMCRGQRRGWTTGHSAQRATGHRPCGPNQPRTLLKWAGNARHIRVSSCQFQALFNSLFKVLCIFPSRYLFAIGLSPIFSFRWNLPPTSSCNPKQPDSTRAHRAAKLRHGTGFSPSPIPCSKGFERRAWPMAPS